MSSKFEMSRKRCARERRRRRPEPERGQASDYIRHLKRYHKRHPELAVVLYLRVSSGPQEDKGNLATYEWKLRRVCRKRGIPIIDVFPETCSGQNLDESRSGLLAACDCARRHEAETGVHTAVLAPCTDRFIRADDYNCKTNPDATPREVDFERLQEFAPGVCLVTYLPPDMPLRDVTSRRTRWGMQYKDRKGGGDHKPGWRKRRRARLQAEARRLREKGWPYRKIKKRLGVSLRTAWEWAKCA